jgi:hypothetical protein
MCHRSDGTMLDRVSREVQPRAAEPPYWRAADVSLRWVRARRGGAAERNVSLPYLRDVVWF